LRHSRCRKAHGGSHQCGSVSRRGPPSQGPCYTNRACSRSGRQCRPESVSGGCAVDLQCRLRRTGRPGRQVHRRSLPATFSPPSGAYRLEFNMDRPSGAWGSSFFAELLPTDEIKNKQLISSAPLSGYGGALVGVSLPPNPRELLLPKVGVSAPVTAIVNFSRPTRSGGPIRAILTLYDPVKRNS